MKHFCISLLLCLASVGLANAAMADKYSVPFSISPGCGQVREEVVCFFLAINDDLKAKLTKKERNANGYREWD